MLGSLQRAHTLHDEGLRGGAAARGAVEGGRQGAIAVQAQQLTGHGAARFLRGAPHCARGTGYAGVLALTTSSRGLLRQASEQQARQCQTTNARYIILCQKIITVLV